MAHATSHTIQITVPLYPYEGGGGVLAFGEGDACCRGKRSPLTPDPLTRLRLLRQEFLFVPPRPRRLQHRQATTAHPVRPWRR
jgi:hypothetical protein